MEKVQSETGVGAMTPEQILELAKQVGLVGKNHTGTGDYMDKFIAFARAVQEKTREECAEKFEEMQSNGDAWVSTVAASAAIRSQE